MFASQMCPARPIGRKRPSSASSRAQRPGDLAGLAVAYGPSCLDYGEIVDRYSCRSRATRQVVGMLNRIGTVSENTRVDGVGEKKAGVAGDKLGETLLARGKITRAQLDEALSVQRHDQRQLGQVLLSAGYVSPADLAMALAERLRLE